MGTSLNDIVRQDIISFLTQTDNELFFNEGDFQLHLATHLLASGHYDDVDIEYYIPYTQINNYIWENELYLDIVVRKSNEYLPIELKYPTAKITKRITRFGEIFPENVVVVKNHGAQDIVKYNIWKDVRRLELVKNRFRSVKNGLSVVLTNDTSYMRKHRDNSIAFNMSTEDGNHNTNRHWLRETSTTSGKPGFTLEKEYKIKWHDCSLDGEPFHYCIIEV